MKTTIDIPEPLLRRAKALAQRQNRTLRDMVEAGLRRELSDTQASLGQFRLRDASVQGNGLSPSLHGSSFSEILDLSYGDRGPSTKL